MDTRVSECCAISGPTPPVTIIHGVSPFEWVTVRFCDTTRVLCRHVLFVKPGPMETDRQFRDRTEAESNSRRHSGSERSMQISRSPFLGAAFRSDGQSPTCSTSRSTSSSRRKSAPREIRSSLSVPSRATEVSGRTRRRSAERAVTRNTSSNSARRKRQTHVRKPNATETIRPNQT